MPTARHAMFASATSNDVNMKLEYNKCLKTF